MATRFPRDGLRSSTLVLAAALLWLASSTPSVRATPAFATIVVNTLADNNVHGDGQCTLREAIDNANNGGDVTSGDCNPGDVGATFIGFSVTGTIGLTSLAGANLPISAFVSINGGSTVTLSGGNSIRHFYVNPGGALTLQNIVLTDGYAGSSYGGAVYVNSGNLRLDHATVQNSHTNGFAGSAVFTSGGTISILNNSLIQNNYGADYGAINSTGVVTVSNSIVHDNRATTGGGAFSVVDLRIDGSQIYSNSVSAGDGGAVYVGVNNRASIHNSQLWANKANHSGGGIYANSNLYVDGSSLSGNSASFGSGGGIANDSGATLVNVSLNANSAPSGSGGGIWNNGIATLTYVTLTGNSAASGGGLKNNIMASLVNVTLSGNSAANGGGIDNSGALLTLNKVSLNVNSATDSGGGMKNTDTARLSDVTFSGNAAQLGGGIDNFGGLLDLSNVTLSGNSAGNRGGAIYNTNWATLHNVTLSNNRALQGGALYLLAGHTTVLTNTIVAYSPSGGNCVGSLTVSQFTLSSDNTCAAGAGMVTIADPLLDGLGNYGGPSTGVEHSPLLTHMIKANSPAKDSVIGNDAPPADERGVIRPQGGGYDIGAVERQLSDVDEIPRLWLTLIVR